MKTLVTLLVLMNGMLCLGQTVSEVLASKHIKGGIGLTSEFLKNESNEITDLRLIENKGVLFDSSQNVIRVGKNVEVYIRPYNPLKYTFSFELEEKDDPIYVEAKKGLFTIIGLLTGFDIEKGDNQQLAPTDMKALDSLKLIYDALSIDTSYSGSIRLLKFLNQDDFMSFDKSRDSINMFNLKVEEALARLNKIDITLSSIEEGLEAYLYEPGYWGDGSISPKWKEKFFEKQIVDFLRELHTKREMLMSQYKEISDKLTKRVNEWKLKKINNEYWILVYENELKFNKILEGDFKLEETYASIDSEGIITVDSTAIFSRSLNLRRNSIVVPEVSSGLIYSMIERTDYATDQANGNTVATINGRPIEQLAISTMLNFNFVTGWKHVHPLLQIGAGLNGEIPQGLIGTGFRFGIGSKSLSLTGGISFSAVKRPETFTIGDIVTGDFDLQNDLKYEFSGFKPYFGLQYNF